MSEEQQDADAYFKNKKSVTISEVALVLKNYVANMKVADPDFQPNVLVGKTLEYTNTFATNKNEETVKKIRSILAEAGMGEQELALVANLQIQGADEAKKLIPSLENRFSDDVLNRLLAEVQTYREFE